MFILTIVYTIHRGGGPPNGGHNNPDSSGGSSGSGSSDNNSYSTWSITFGIFFVVILFCLIMRCCAGARWSNGRRNRRRYRSQHPNAQHRVEIARELANLENLENSSRPQSMVDAPPSSDAAPMDPTQLSIATAESMTFGGETGHAINDIPAVKVVSNNRKQNHYHNVPSNETEGM